MRDTRRRNLLLLNDEENSRLAEAIREHHVSRSFIILEAIQAGLQARVQPKIPGRRKRVVYFRLPAEIKAKIKELAEKHKASQQSLLRHFLDAYLAKLDRMHPRTTRPGSQSEVLLLER